MVAVNRLTTPANMRWKLIDRTTGAANAAGTWSPLREATGNTSTR